MFIFLLVLMVLVLFVFIALVKYKNIDIWFFSYIKSSFSKKTTSKPKHIMFCFVDHFEPQWHKSDAERRPTPRPSSFSELPFISGNLVHTYIDQDFRNSSRSGTSVHVRSLCAYLIRCEAENRTWPRYLPK